MKKLFNHTKKPAADWKGYDENDYDWDEPDHDGEEGYFEEEEYIEETADIQETSSDGEAEYYADEEGAEEAAYEESEYYEGGEESAYEEPEYYEGGEESAYEDPEYYEGAEEAAYEESGYYEGEEEAAYEDPEYYEGEEESAYEGDQEYYADDQFEEDGYDDELEENSGKGFFQRLWQGIAAMSGMDKVIMGTGAAVLVLAVVTGSMYISARTVDRQVAGFASVGSQLDGIETIGGQGLLAVADAEIARMAAAEVVQDQETRPSGNYQEAEYGREITVSMSLTSIQKDLKIKFFNKANGKLISNVPFAITVTGPDGKSTVWSDDDMDGIIYKTDITPGNYTVAMEQFSNDQYSNYIISDQSQKVEVKKDIDYKKVDVANEIKKESEINASKEDTKQNVTEVESVLEDTVAWVASTKVEYHPVPKSSIPNPETLVSVRRLGALNTVAETRDVSGSDPGTPDPTPTVTPTPEPTPTVTPTPTPTVTPDPGASPSVSPTPSVSPSSSASPSPSVSPSPTPTPLGITLDKTEVKILTGKSDTVKATLAGKDPAVTAPTVTAASANSDIAKVASISGTTVTVEGVSAGTTAFTVSYTEKGKTVSVNFSVTVTADPRQNGTALKDNGGRQLYVLENGTYRTATYADYYKTDQFYIYDPKYTGWQSIDGKLYYYTANGDRVTGEQVIQGAKYNFASDGSLVKGSGSMGIDVSKWNGNIDWTAVSNSGVSYVIIRCGYRGSSQGSLIEDPKFLANIKGATDAGLKVGVYFFTQAVNEVEAVEEASMVLEQIKGYKISYPVFLDVEPSGGRADSIDVATRTAVCRAFCETIQRGGYTAGIYANKTWFTNKINTSELNAYKFWLAQYAATPTYTGRYDLWQYRSTGKVNGITGNVDMNLSYLGY